MRQMLVQVQMLNYNASFFFPYEACSCKWPHFVKLDKLVMNCFSQTDDSIQVNLYSCKLEKQSPQGALYCEVNTLLYSGEKSQESNNPL